MRLLAEITAELGIAGDELRLWIERRWVLPMAHDGDYVFSEADIARVQMIIDLRHDLAIDDEAMPVVLDLLDKLHGLRRQMRDLLTAIDELPEAQREALIRRVGGSPGVSGGDDPG
jgi:chaperone modulatory protein CbpM